MHALDVMQFARNCQSKTPLLLLRSVTLHCPHARPISFYLSPCRARISVRIFRISHSRRPWPSFILAWHGMAWHGNPRHQQLGIHGDSRRTLASVSGSESCASPDRDLISIWQPDHLLIWFVDKENHDSSKVNGCNMYPHPILDAWWIPGGREVGSISGLESSRLAFWLSESLWKTQW
jgi:hypothetical protein